MMGEIILRVMAWAAQAELESIKRRIEAGVRRAGRGRKVPGTSQGVDSRPDRRHPAAAPERAVPVRGGADLRRLPSDRLARRAAGVAAQAPRNSPGRGRFASMRAGRPTLPPHQGPGWRLVRESVDRLWKAEPAAAPVRDHVLPSGKRRGPCHLK